MTLIPNTSSHRGIFPYYKRRVRRLDHYERCRNAPGGFEGLNEFLHGSDHGCGFS